MKLLVLVWAALLVLLGLTAGISELHLGVAAAEAAAVSIALCKTGLVVFFFMELRETRWAMRVAAATATLMFLILLGGTISDFHARRYNAPPAAAAAPGVPAPRPDKVSRETLDEAGFE